MKRLFHIILLSITLSAHCQDGQPRVRAFGVDLFKNVPFLLFPMEKNTVSQEINYYCNPLILESYVQLFTQKPRRFITIGLGYAAINTRIEKRISQTTQGYYIKIGREHYSKVSSPSKSMFWGYNLTLTHAKVNSAIDIQGQYFPGYYAPLPAHARLGITGDLSGGINFLVFRRLEVRFAGRSSIILSNIGNPNSSYLPGAGIRFWEKPLTVSGGGTIQFFYLIKRPPKRNLPN